MGGPGSGKRRKKPPKDVEFFDNREIWEKHPWESDKSFAGFTAYRDLGLYRTLVSATERLGKTPSYVKVMEAWSKKFRWRERVNAYDMHLDKAQRDAEVDELVAMRKRHIQLAVHLQGLGATELQKWLKKAKESKGSVTVTPDQVLKLVEVGVKLERLNRGEATAIVKNDMEIKTPEEMDERIKQLMQLFEG